MLIYINCNNIQTSLQSNRLIVSSTFSNSSYDHVRTLFILKCIEQLLIKCTKEFLIAISTTTITNLSNLSTNSTFNTQVFSVHNEKLLDLILKHLRSIYGENFYASSQSSTGTSSFNFSLNSTTYLEAITLILLFYIRSYYPPSRFVLKTTTGEDIKIPKSSSINSLCLSVPQAGPVISEIVDDSKRDLNDQNLYQENRNIQIYSLKILSQLFKELNSLTTSQASNNSSSQIQKSIIDFMEKLKLQKTFLHLFYSSIYQPGQSTLSNLILQSSNLNTSKQIQYSYITELISCLENLIDLERILNDHQLTVKYLKNGLPSNPSSARLRNDVDLGDDFLLTMSQNTKKLNPGFGASSNFTANNSQGSQSQSTRYIPTQSICNQSMFISSILYYLKNMSLVEYHMDVLRLIKNTLPSSGNSLKSISTYIIEQLCRNLLYITNGGITTGSSSSSGNYIQPIIAYMSHVSMTINIPDLLISMLKQLSFMLNYCLISGSSSNSIYFNLNNELNYETQFKLFRQFQVDNELNLTQAKECLLHLFPSIVSSMAQVWQRCNLLLNSQNLYSGLNVIFDQQLYQQIQQHQQQMQQYSWILGHPYVIKQCVTDLLNPIAQSHSTQFMIAIGTVWGEKRKKSRVYQDHKVIIELVRSLKSFPISVIIQNITEILKQSNLNSNKDKVRNFNINKFSFKNTIFGLV